MLRGTSISHFGAFFDSSGASTTCSGAGSTRPSRSSARSCPPEHPELDALIDEAHRTIVEDFAAERVAGRCPRASWDVVQDVRHAGRRRERARRSPCSTAPPSCWARSSAGSPAARRRSRPGWKAAVRRSCARTRAAWRVVHILAKLLFLGTTLGLVALVAWIALLVGGHRLVVVDVSACARDRAARARGAARGRRRWRALVAIARIRASAQKRVGVFICQRVGTARSLGRPSTRS